jgi:sec-independent protein translocase protein TatA
MGSGLVSPLHLAIVALVALVIFGPKKLPELGQGLGRGMRDFKRGISGDDLEDEKAVKAVVVEEPAAEAGTTPPA